MGIRSSVIPITDLSQKNIHEMLCIMQTYYCNVTKNQFLADLNDKERVILLYDNGCICGFSTQKLLDHDINGQHLKVIFSGDTVIKENYRWSLALPITWGQMMLSILSEYPDRELYWFVISKGYKTYRFLPIFFKEYFPSFAGEMSDFDKALICSLAKRKYGNRYDYESGIIRAVRGSQYLRPGVADITERRLRDKHIDFFNRINPNHVFGDELACIARCHEDNLNPFILRRLYQ